jgi:MFS family permease
VEILEVRLDGERMRTAISTSPRDLRAPATAGGVSMGIVALLTVASFINYVDRGSLATAAPLVREEFGLSSTQLGLLLSAFFWSYAPGQVPAGWLAERLDARRVLACGLVIWGAATALAGPATGFVTLLVLRMLLGCGESVMFPASFKILACEATEGQRGRANGFLASGLYLGSAFGTLIGALLMARLGWRVVFIAAGCASLLWLWPWCRTPKSTAAHRTQATPGGPSTLTLLRRRELWGSCAGAFCGAYALYLVVTGCRCTSSRLAVSPWRRWRRSVPLSICWQPQPECSPAGSRTVGSRGVRAAIACARPLC